MNKIRECLRLARWLSNDLLGDLEESERESLDAWLAASPEHPAKYETLRTSVIKKDLSEDRMAIAKVAWHEFDRKNIKRLKKPLFLRYVAVAAILCFIGAGILYYFRDVPEIVAERILPGEAKAILELSDGRTYDLTEDGGIKNVIAENIVADSCGLEYLRKKDTISSNVMSYHKLTIPRGGIFHLFLEDGTEIWLNSESKLVYPEAFTGKTREVYLEGEAYFDVAEDAACPFIVHSGGLYAKVLGTSFGVTNYTEENTMSLTLVSGKVQTEFPAISDEVYFLTGLSDFL